MKKLRIYNRYAFAKIFGGLVGWPLGLLVLYSGGFERFTEASFIAQVLLIICAIVGPFFVLYRAWWALTKATTWIDFGSRIRVRKLLSGKFYERGELASAKLERKDVGWDFFGLGLAEVPMLQERYVKLFDRRGRLVASLHISAADRAKLIEHLRQTPI